MMKVTQVSIDRWMDKQSMIYPHNGILFNLKKEWNSDMCYNMAEPWGHDVSEIGLSHNEKCIIPLIKGT